MTEILELAKQGLRLFPVIARDKKPLIQDWPHLASSSAEQSHEWEKTYRDCNWGMACGKDSGIAVLDFDGELGRSAFQLLVVQYGQQWTETRAVKTPRGCHLWFRYPQGREIRNSAGKIAAGVDHSPRSWLKVTRPISGAAAHLQPQVSSGAAPCCGTLGT